MRLRHAAGVAAALVTILPLSACAASLQAPDGTGQEGVVSLAIRLALDPALETDVGSAVVSRTNGRVQLWADVVADVGEPTAYAVSVLTGFELVSAEIEGPVHLSSGSNEVSISWLHPTGAGSDFRVIFRLGEPDSAELDSLTTVIRGVVDAPSREPDSKVCPSAPADVSANESQFVGVALGAPSVDLEAGNGLQDSLVVGTDLEEGHGALVVLRTDTGTGEVRQISCIWVEELQRGQVHLYPLPFDDDERGTYQAYYFPVDDRVMGDESFVFGGDASNSVIML